MKAVGGRLAALMIGLLVTVPLIAHPGHEYHVEGTISKLNSPHFDVKDKDGGITSFMIVPSTEVTLGRDRALPADIKVGVVAEVDGVENERGIVEAKKVKLLNMETAGRARPSPVRRGYRMRYTNVAQCTSQ